MQSRQRLALLVVAISLSLAMLTVAVWAQSSSSFELAWYSFDGGGKASATHFRLAGAMGQADAGQLSSASYKLHGGFQQAFSHSSRLYLPSIVH